ncbi:hypothetical protein R3P38DRAFT_3048452, partial [Favolaschia claudopus]
MQKYTYANQVSRIRESELLFGTILLRYSRVGWMTSSFDEADPGESRSIKFTNPLNQKTARTAFRDWTFLIPRKLFNRVLMNLILVLNIVQVEYGPLSMCRIIILIDRSYQAQTYQRAWQWALGKPVIKLSLIQSLIFLLYCGPQKSNHSRCLNHLYVSDRGPARAWESMGP